jgi:hypothetical protein
MKKARKKRRKTEEKKKEIEQNHMMLCRSGGPRPKTTQSAAGARGLRGGPAPMVALLAMYEHVYTVTSVPRAGYAANVYYKFVAF